MQINNAVLPATGKLRLYVLVGTDGRAKKVTPYGMPDGDLVKYAAMAVAVQRYKPAICQGQPCEMIYPLEFDFKVR